MNGGRLLAGVGAVVLVISGLGFATPTAADANGQDATPAQISADR